MAFDIGTFISRLQFGGARPNQFEVLLPFPLASGSSTVTSDFSFMCRASSLPGESLGTISVPYFGREVKLAGDRQFGNWNVTVINDEDFKVRDAFEKWSNAINGHVSNLRNPLALTLDGYIVDATVKQYGKTGDVIKEYDMIGCWPTSVSEIALGWDGNSAIEEFSVEFAVQYWTARTTT